MSHIYTCFLTLFNVAMEHQEDFKNPTPLEDPRETGGLVITFELPDQSSLLADFCGEFLGKDAASYSKSTVFYGIQLNSDVF